MDNSNLNMVGLLLLKGKAILPKDNKHMVLLLKDKVMEIMDNNPHIVINRDMVNKEEILISLIKEAISNNIISNQIMEEVTVIHINNNNQILTERVDIQLSNHLHLKSNSRSTEIIQNQCLQDLQRRNIYLKMFKQENYLLVILAVHGKKTFTNILVNLEKSKITSFKETKFQVHRKVLDS